jgi:LmbE family N-acetylglucosaminyl deacetylase
MTKYSEDTRKTILAVLAHPDDESFGMGGTLALYAQRGVKVHLICATRGEEGEIDPEYKKKIKSAACLRTQELRCAAEVLGIHQLHFMNYRDSGMSGSPANHHPKALAAQPIEKLTKEVAHFIRKIKPDVVITFDPIGGYRHPDHIAIQKATVEGFDLASDTNFQDPEDLPPFQPNRLFFHIMNRTYLKMMVRVLRLIGKDPRKWGRNQDIDLVSLTDVDYPTHAKINYRPVKELKEKAAACHASQGGGEMNKGFRGFVNWLFGGHHDGFMQAFPKPQLNQKTSQDLFS